MRPTEPKVKLLRPLKYSRLCQYHRWQPLYRVFSVSSGRIFDI